jgi:DNA-binding CsgD family transcriptional regulator
VSDPKTLTEILADLRACLPARRRRIAASADAASHMARLIGASRLLAIEDRPGGFAFRLENAETGVRITCVLHHSTPAPLTAAEAAVAERLCDGRTLAQIAQLRGVSVNTIKSQVRQIFRKLEVESRVALVRRLAP